MRRSTSASFDAIRNKRSIRAIALAFFAIALLLALASIAGEAQQTPVAAQNAPAAPAVLTLPQNAKQTAQGVKQTQEATQPKTVRSSNRRRAAKLYLAASKLFEKGQFEEAMHGYQKASLLDPGNSDYSLAVNVARSHAVTALVQAAAKDRIRGDEAAARKALAHGLELEPHNSLVGEHIDELGDDALIGQKRPVYEQGAKTVGDASVLAPARSVHSFHLHTDARQVIHRSSRLMASIHPSTAACTPVW